MTTSDLQESISDNVTKTIYHGIHSVLQRGQDLRDVVRRLLPCPLQRFDLGGCLLKLALQCPVVGAQVLAFVARPFAGVGVAVFVDNANALNLVNAVQLDGVIVPSPECQGTIKQTASDEFNGALGAWVRSGVIDEADACPTLDVVDVEPV